MKLIVGLGNPGKAYADTRHNVGFRCINRLAKLYNIPLNQRQCRSRLGIGEIAGAQIILAKPQTFMNLSGKAVSLLVQKFQVPFEDLIVISDDLDLPLGKIRIRQGGSSGGHKGLESIIKSLGSQDFARIRIGIGHPEGEMPDTVAYVLSSFTPEEKGIIEEAIARVGEAIYCLLTEGVSTAMNRFNSPSPDLPLKGEGFPNP